jgi:hypothetical protein
MATDERDDTKVPRFESLSLRQLGYFLAAAEFGI